MNTATNHSVLYLAARNGHVEIVKVLIDAETDVNPTTALNAAAFRKDTECLKLLLDAGADVNDSYNKVALAITAMNGYDQCMSLLIDAGADVNQRYSDGKSALILATEKCHIKCMKLFITNGAQVNWNTASIRHFSKHLFPLDQHVLRKLFWLFLAAGVDSCPLNLIFPKSSLTYPSERA